MNHPAEPDTFNPMHRPWKLWLTEPYRIFFPLGLIAGIFGVMMWPLWYGKLLSYYPIDAHTRMMIEGFMGAFVAGFIGTAYPRLTGNKPWHALECIVLLGLWSITVFAHGRGQVATGDGAFSTMLTVMMAGMVWRWRSGNQDTPPPGFTLAIVGITGAAVAAAYLASQPIPNTSGERLAKLFLFQGFLLLPLMGIAPYLLPRFFGRSSTHAFEDSPTPPPGWCMLAAKSLIAGMLIISSFLLEINGSPSAGHVLRAVVLVAWFMLETPLFLPSKQPNTTANAVRIALCGLLSGLACAAIAPPARIGSLHLFFISGLGLFTLAVGTRVILGHAGRHDRLVGKIIWLRWVIGLILLAALTRMTCDFLPKVKITHQIYAAWTWALAALIWFIALARFLTRDETLTKNRRSCPRRRVQNDSPPSQAS